MKEVRSLEENPNLDDSKTISGYGAVFGSTSQDLGGFREIIAPGAFNKTLRESPDILSLWNHDSKYVLGRTSAGTMRVGTDERGLWYQVDLPDNTYGNDLHVSIKRGDVSQSSFGFAAIKDAWTLDEEDYPLRTLHEVQLFEISPVSQPAYLETSIDARSLDGTFALERLAREKQLDLAEVRANLTEVIRGNTKPVESTYVDPYFDPADIIVIKGRFNRG